MQIKIVPRYKVVMMYTENGSELFHSFNIISINDSELVFNETYGNLLSLVFDDIELDFGRNLKLFDMEQAKQVVNFLDKMYFESRAYKPLLIHCTAGVSRSGAVGEFACKYLGYDYERFRKDNRQIVPNTHVLKTLWKVSDGRSPYV